MVKTSEFSLFCLLLFLAALPLTVFSQNDSAQNSEVTEPTIATTKAATQSADRPIEEIQVRGIKTLLSMRNEIRREEESLYRLFNDLNEIDKFDIHCRSQRRTGSHIPRHSCEPVFLTEFRRQNNRDAIAGMRNAYSSEGIDTQLLQSGLDLLQAESEIQRSVSAEYEALNEEILRIAMENPNYFAALIKLGELKTVYSAARKAKFGNK